MGGARYDPNPLTRKNGKGQANAEGKDPLLQDSFVASDRRSGLSESQLSAWQTAGVIVVILTASKQ